VGVIVATEDPRSPLQRRRVTRRLSLALFLLGCAAVLLQYFVVGYSAPASPKTTDLILSIVLACWIGAASGLLIGVIRRRGGGSATRTFRKRLIGCDEGSGPTVKTSINRQRRAVVIVFLFGLGAVFFVESYSQAFNHTYPEGIELLIDLLGPACWIAAIAILFKRRISRKAPEQRNK
jgi:peptidoglycan/LPS O-acetylase OafA/YrhL